MGTPLGLAFAAGLLAAFNPCGFALLPAYLAYFVGVSGRRAEDGPPHPVRAVLRALVVAASLTAGFVVVFGVVGAVVSVASVQVSRYAPWLTVVVGVALVGLGLAMLAGKEVRVSLPRFGAKIDREAGLGGIFLFGISYATVSLSCTLPPFLAAVTSTFEQNSFFGGLATFGLYALGMGSVVAVLSVAVALAQSQVVSFLRRAQRYIQWASGALLVLAGSYAAWYGVYEILINRGYDVGGGPVALVARVSSSIGLAIGDAGSVRIGVGAAAFVGVALLIAVGLRLLGPRSDPTPGEPG